MKNRVLDFLWKFKYILLFLALFATLVTQRFTNELSDGLAGTVSSDGVSYYAYLPSTLIYQDFSYSFYQDENNKIKTQYRPYFSAYTNNTWLNKYYCGTPICILPFFILGILVSFFAGTTMNGYTDTFLMLVSIAPIVYYLLSVGLIIRIGKFFGLSEKTSFWASLLFLVGTNLFHYVIQEPTMSHSYSFFAVTLFLYLVTRVVEACTSKNLILLALSLVLVTLLRPPNIVVVLFVPFFFKSFLEFIAFFKLLFTTHLKSFLLASFVFAAGLFLQCVFYYLQTGEFFVMAYPGEPFYFDDPEFFNILFSYSKGLFMYTPLLFVCLVFVFFSKGEGFKKMVFLITASLFLYITASWWCWTYGGGFGNRPFIDIYPLLLLLVLLVFNQANRFTQKIFITLCLPFLFLNQVMAYQYSHQMMNTIGDVTKNDYWDSFLKTTIESINRKKVNAYILHQPVVKSQLFTFESTTDAANLVKEGYKSHMAALVGKSSNYSPGHVIAAKELEKGTSYYLLAECMAKADKAGRRLGLAISIREGGVVKKWYVTFYAQFSNNNDGWVYMNNLVRIDKYDLSPKSEILIFAISNTGNCLVDNQKYTLVKEHTQH